MRVCVCVLLMSVAQCVVLCVHIHAFIAPLKASTFVLLPPVREGRVCVWVCIRVGWWCRGPIVKSLHPHYFLLRGLLQLPEKQYYTENLPSTQDQIHQLWCLVMLNSLLCTA